MKLKVYLHYKGNIVEYNVDSVVITDVALTIEDVESGCITASIYK